MKDGSHLQINYIPSTLLPGARLVFSKGLSRMWGMPIENTVWVPSQDRNRVVQGRRVGASQRS